MAVYTKLNRAQITSVLRNFPDLPRSDFKFQGITMGTVNTIYRITFPGRRVYYLKIDEVADEVRLQSEILILKILCRHKDKLGFEIPCPLPTRNKNKFYIPFMGKFALITPAVQGRPLYRPKLKLSHLHTIGAMMARLHKIKSTGDIRTHRYCLDGIIKAFARIQQDLQNKHPAIHKDLRRRLAGLKKNNPLRLPSCIIHADIFPENVFWVGNHFSGIIDFESAGLGSPLFDLSVSVHSLCFHSGQYDLRKITSLLRGYHSVRKINKQDLRHMDYFLELTATRFLVTRLTGFELPRADPKAENFKDYREYKNILEVLPRLKITPTTIFS